MDGTGQADNANCMRLVFSPKQTLWEVRTESELDGSGSSTGPENVGEASLGGAVLHSHHCWGSLLFLDAQSCQGVGIYGDEILRPLLGPFRPFYKTPKIQSLAL